MKAVKCLKYGGTENLVLGDVEKPLPKYHEVLIKIKAKSDKMKKRFTPIISSVTFACIAVIIHNHRYTYYPATYKYLFLNAGYGFQISLFKDTYLGTNFKIGTFTFNKTSENPHIGFQSIDFFDEAGFNLDFQLHLNYFF